MPWAVQIDHCLNSKVTFNVQTQSSLRLRVALTIVDRHSVMVQRLFESGRCRLRPYDNPAGMLPRSAAPGASA